MEKLKFALFSIVTLSLLGLLGYWSVSTIQSGSDHVSSQKIKQLEKENEDLKTEVQKLADAQGDLQSKLEEVKPDVTNPVVPVAPTVSKYQSLIDELQKLVDGKVSLKLKSSGAEVGTVQKFLNIYNNINNKMDNDYGDSTKASVAIFQKDQGLSSDGQAGPGTFSKMIDWLKKQA